MRTIPKSSDAALRARGLRLTSPRRVVLEGLRGTDAHPTAESVHRLVRRRLPRVSLGTAYRNLRLLVAEGLAAEIPGPHARFDANMDAHHHFTCVRCGRIVDVDGPLPAVPVRQSPAASAASLTLSLKRPTPKEEKTMAGKSIKGTKSHENLKEAFAGESQANRRYLYFARVADIEGFPDMAGLFKDTADAETGDAFGHLDFLKEVGDP